MPGGTVEKGENVENTLVREVKEETNRDVQVGSIQPFFYQEAFKKEKMDSGIVMDIKLDYWSLLIKIMNLNLIQTREILLKQSGFRLRISQNILIGKTQLQ